jgi:hypothetical protein
LKLTSRSGNLGLLAKSNLAEDFLEEGLVDTGDEPAGNVLERTTESGVKDQAVEVQQGGNDGDVSEGDLLADKVGFGEEVVVQGSQDFLDVFLGSLGVLQLKKVLKFVCKTKPSNMQPTTYLLVVGDPAHNGVEPGGSGGGNFIVSKGNELLNK